MLGVGLLLATFNASSQSERKEMRIPTWKEYPVQKFMETGMYLCLYIVSTYSFNFFKLCNMQSLNTASSVSFPI